ncbi:L,D-transpeptidase [Alsobacter soli]|uniref:L,D-transpeptidase n=1 Tax=Alsobacter soli TaxID=2109933 RepID=A0A2T1HMP1_9HYPH|nr:L,D-transpeptidase [Alsobacter soli]PSC02934.1 L,D-transpeptidase [Alsobacter soli]
MRFLARCLVAVVGLIAGSFALLPGAQATVRVNVDLTTQTMHVSSDEGGSHTWKISSARKGYVTPRGVYRAQRLEKMHYSRKYDLSPMPHSIFFKGGYAIHGTGAVGSLGRPASHGCVRLAKGNAAQLYAMVQKEGAVITITGSAPTTAVASGPRKAKSYASARHRTPATYAARRAPAEPLGYAPSPAPVSAKSWARSPVGWWLFR